MTPTVAAARRYADAYFTLARTAGDIQGWRRELTRAAETLSNDEVTAAVVNPRIAIADRVALALNLLDGVATPACNLVRLLIERGRIGLLPGVLAEFDRLADEDSGRVVAEVITAVPLAGDLADAVERRLMAMTAGTVEMVQHVDPSIVGGLIVRIGDRVIDSSVRAHLHQLQAALA